MLLQMASHYEMLDSHQFTDLYPRVCEDLGVEPMPLDAEVLKEKLFTRSRVGSEEAWEALQRFGIGVDPEDMRHLYPELEKRRRRLAGEDEPKPGQRKSRPSQAELLEGDPFD